MEIQRLAHQTQSSSSPPPEALLTSCLELRDLGSGLQRHRSGVTLLTAWGVEEEGAAAVGGGRDRHQETPMRGSLGLEEETTVGVGGRNARRGIPSCLAWGGTIVEIVETVGEV